MCRMKVLVIVGLVVTFALVEVTGLAQQGMTLQQEDCAPAHSKP